MADHQADAALSGELSGADKATMAKELSDLSDRILASRDEADILHVARVDLLRFAAHYQKVTDSPATDIAARALDLGHCEHLLKGEKMELESRVEALAEREKRLSDPTYLNQKEQELARNEEELANSKKEVEALEAAVLNAREIHIANLKAITEQNIELMKREASVAAREAKHQRDLEDLQAREFSYKNALEAVNLREATLQYSGAPPIRLPARSSAPQHQRLSSSPDVEIITTTRGPIPPPLTPRRSNPATFPNTLTPRHTVLSRDRQILSAREKQQEDVYNLLADNVFPTVTPSNQTRAPTDPRTLHDLHSSIYSTTFRQAFEVGRRSAPQVSYNLHLSALDELQQQVKNYKSNWGHLAASGNLTKSFETLETIINQHIDYTNRAASTKQMTVDEMCAISMNNGQAGNHAQRMRSHAGVSDQWNDDAMEVGDDDDQNHDFTLDHACRTALANVTGGVMHVMDLQGNTTTSLGVPDSQGNATMTAGMTGGNIGRQISSRQNAPRHGFA
ncbi:hypothetical protein QBC44DRAFT_372164 [Cladorrhinum sp. PSN332]|nr:hypothetical protein QBC44DRAFT_372164 [Cladorrhinum sp. PSN332]